MTVGRAGSRASAALILCALMSLGAAEGTSTPEVAGAPSQAPAAYKIGDRGPAGGFVFYDKGEASEGWRYLEAAPRDQTDAAGIEWKSAEFISIKTDTAVGSGKANTSAIIAAQGEGRYAATICAELDIGGYKDWFLPSKDELDAMYVNLRGAGLGGFSDAWYWSSSQIYYNYFAWYENFEVGFQGSSYKSAEYLVRACREF